MIFRSFTILAALAIATPAMARDWAVDPSDSGLALTIHQGQTPISARFERFDATIRFDPAALDRSEIEVIVDLASFASGEAQRDAQAKGADFLKAEGDARAVYRTVAIEALDDSRYRLEAELTLKGITRQLRHEATITVEGDRAHAKGTVPLIRTDFNVGTGQFATGSLIGLEVEVHFDIRAHAR